MRERPILFSAPMVRAILAGTKTQTRRVAPVESIDIRDIGDGTISWAAKFSEPVRSRVSGGRATGTYSGGRFTRDQAVSIIAADFCPYGQPGDRLWVRETFMDLRGTGVEHRDSAGNRQRYAYAADTRPGSYGDECRKDYGLKWRPSIHMPRAAIRITLEVTAVRVERLQDISEADAMAEGCYTDPACPAYDAYRSLWESINGPGSWDANPWVWVIEFKRVMP